MHDRYSRQALFKPIGTKGQNKLKEKHVVIVGAGALGTASAETLVRAGVGRISIIDRDYVEWSNLQRQQLYTEEDVKLQLPKAVAAENKLHLINSDVVVKGYVMDANPRTLVPFIEKADIIMDATDNLETRLVINDLSLLKNKPWIYGSCVGSTGMTYSVIPYKTPCLRCLLKVTPMQGATCDTAGIIPTTVQLVSAYQATEVLKYLVEDHKHMNKSLQIFDMWNNQNYSMIVDKAKRNDCPTCGQNPSFPALKDENQTKVAVLCGRDTVQIRMFKKIDLDQLEIQLLHYSFIRNPYLLSVNVEEYRIVFFYDGRALVHGTKDINQAKKIFDRIVG
ncbi:ThiF family adenylyltransferase [Bacillus carboniphilus]|uniref:ThiF family adenylyltransferase n=1 Tax=Bacillus carboniphilus TaxID=86663 RepID=A0ABY9JV44_9BACI|nr:ThiF family adenylyltransferase [Bacillus carboniphilus]WLR42373.1 ThiF family adenylyltransferase [Bacillus carboniphilus]